VGREVFRKVINISSIAGLYGNFGQISYLSAKVFLIALTRTLAKDWGRFKLNVNCVAFGYIETLLTQAIAGEQKSIEVEGREIKFRVQPQLLATFINMVPLGRGGTPEEAADGAYCSFRPNPTTSAGRGSYAAAGGS